MSDLNPCEVQTFQRQKFKPHFRVKSNIKCNQSASVPFS